MKLESLKSSKFEAMTNSQMSAIKGGYAERTGGGIIYLNGKSQRYSEDCFDVLQNGTYGDMSYLVEGKWYTI